MMIWRAFLCFTPKLFSIIKLFPWCEKYIVIGRERAQKWPNSTSLIFDPFNTFLPQIKTCAPIYSSYQTHAAINCYMKANIKKMPSSVYGISSFQKFLRIFLKMGWTLQKASALLGGEGGGKCLSGSLTYQALSIRLNIRVLCQYFHLYS